MKRAARIQIDLRKYRSILLSLVLFMVLDFGVLTFNFATSYFLEDTNNLMAVAGRQADTSQRIARTVLELTEDKAAGRPYNAPDIVELRKSVQLFDTSLKALSGGGVAPGADGQPLHIMPITTPHGREVLQEIFPIWIAYKQVVDPISLRPTIAERDLDAAVAYSRSNNAAFLRHVIDLSDETYRISDAHNKRLRMVQIVGFALALVIFMYALLKSVRQLAASDQAVAKSQKETQEILATVKEGLFLLDANHRIGEQRSKSLTEIFQRTLEPDANFMAILQSMVSADTLDSVKDYLNLLFGDKVKEALVKSLNPLAQVQVQMRRGQPRWFSFQFNRVINDGTVTHLLVTVQDATDRVALAAEVDALRNDSHAELHVMLGLLSSDPAALNRFVHKASKALADINDLLRMASERGGANYRQLTNNVFRTIHTVKGDAAAMNLEAFEALAHDFETLLVTLRDKENVVGEDMVPLMLHLDAFYERIHRVKSMMDQFGHRLGAGPVTDERANASRNVAVSGTELVRGSSFVANLEQLLIRTASNQQKKVQLSADVTCIHELSPEIIEELQQIAIQLIRNAVTHGIESPDERLANGKDESGRVLMTLKASPDGGHDFLLRDDGRGVSPPAIRAAMVKSGKYTAEEAAQVPDHDVAKKIFESGFSTAESVGKDAGRGVGMDVIREKVIQIGGSLRMSSVPGRLTEFRIRLAPAMSISA